MYQAKIVGITIEAVFPLEKEASGRRGKELPPLSQLGTRKLVNL